MSKRILFVFRNNEWLGIEYLSSVLKQAGHITDLVYDPGMGDVEFKFKALEKVIERKVYNNMLNKAKRFSPDIIAFSCHTNLYPWVSNMAMLFKKVFNVPIIAGGMHPTFFPEIVISNPNIDIICRGEGEEAFLELVNNMEEDREDLYIRNLWFKRNGEIIRNEIRPLLGDLDSLPFPDKDLFYQYRCFSDRAYVMSGRGCPYDCTYCFNHAMKNLYKGKGPYLRRRSVQNVIQELKMLKEKYKIKEVFFYDDIFTLDLNWLRQFKARYKEEIKLPFKCMVRANCLSEEIAIILKEMGCIYVDMGVESGSDKVRNRIMNRNLTENQILSAGNYLRQAGIKFNTLNIFGSPGELPCDMEETVSINRKLKPSGTFANVLYPFPGTKIAELAQESNYIDNKVKEQIEKGEGTYRGATLLKHPFEKLIFKYHTFMPIMVRLPKKMDSLILNLPPWGIFRIISIFFITNPRNLLIRIKEQVQSIYYALFKQ